MMPEVIAYTIYNQEYHWKVETDDRAREYAKRIVMEGLWAPTGETEETFYPPDKIVKVKVKDLQFNKA